MDDTETPGFGLKVARLLNRAEYIYLRILRGVVLLLATLLILYAVWLASVALYKISRSPDSVVEKKAEVSAPELVEAVVPAQTLPIATEAQEAKASAEEHRAYGQFVKSYFGLYRSQFERFKRPEDKSLSQDEFDDAFVQSQDRLSRIAQGKLNASEDLADLDTLLTTMTAAASNPETVKRLERYRSAAKVQTCNNVDRVRTEYRSGWDRYSMACSDWYADPMGCPVRRPVAIPYQERVCSMQLPKGVASYTQVFRAFQDRFFDLLTSRRQQYAEEAAQERSAIELGVSEGKASFGWALYVFGGFLVLMFFFLLIAIEKHQRRLSDAEPAPVTE
ncbi:hypothetical protein ACFSCW_14595 [Sphingomonas tabacisoli]|uniref:Uncharacterized protein n=1 Tax=Sphingomonas tabacisoli TaxID=2249466 RepID=A0ABW4I4W3_9SPHN